MLGTALGRLQWELCFHTARHRPSGTSGLRATAVLGADRGGGAAPVLV